MNKNQNFGQFISDLSIRHSMRSQDLAKLLGICRKYLIGCWFDVSLNVDFCNRKLRENDLNCLTPSVPSSSAWY